MTVLITGASGFVGLNLCEHLLARGEKVVAFSMAPMPAPALRDFAALPGVLRVVEGDVSVPSEVETAFREAGAERVIHAAAMTPGGRGEKDNAARVMEVNVVGTANVLEAAWRHGVKRVLHLSSGAVYGENALAAPELDEEHPAPVPNTLYGISKYAGERTALRLRALRRLDLVAVRLGAVYGPWEYPSGVRDTLSAPLLASSLALDGGTALLSHQGRRDWLYARDVAAGLARLLDAPAPPHALYNLGSGREWDMSGWCERLGARYPDFSWRIAAGGEEPNVELWGSTRRSPMSTARLREDTGFEARFGLAESFEDYLPWLEAHREFIALPQGKH